jgi:signal transduction histidine kinase
VAERWLALGLSLLLAAVVSATLLLDFNAPQRAGQAAPVHHTQAELAISSLGEQELQLGRHLPESAILALPAAQRQLPPADGAAWQLVVLPDHATREAALQSGRRYALEMRWYRVQHRVAEGEPLSQALHIARAVGGPVLVMARRDSAEAPWRLLLDNTPDWLSQWNRPLYVALPPELTAPGTVVQIAIGLPTVHGVQYGLAAPLIGPAPAVAWQQQRRQFWQVTAMQLLSLSGLVLGALALALAWRRQQPGSHLLFAAITSVWAVRNLHYFVAPPGERVAYEWFWWATNSSISWLTLLFYLFVLRFLPRRYVALERALLGFCVVLSLLTIPLWPLQAEALVMQHALNVAVALGVCLFLAALALRGAGTEFSLLVGTLFVGIVLATHDLLLLSGRLPPEHLYLLPYSCLLLLFSFQHALARQHAAAFADLAQANAEQELRLAAQQAQLEAHHETLVGFEREQALLRERQRLMRDMHDGLGSALLSSLALVQGRQLSQPAVAGLLRECIDDLRLVIDSLEPIENDLATLLGTLRLRLGDRLAAAGLQLHWAVDDVPPLDWLDPPSALQVLRLAQEMFTNVLKHAHARHVQVSLRRVGNDVQVEIADDGVGCAAASLEVCDASGGNVGGRGLRNMRTRAASLAARVEFESRPGEGTRVRLLLPIVRVQ